MADDILGQIRASKKKFYVYILRKPDGTPFYVGMGKGVRVLRHERLAHTESAKGYRLSVIRKIWRDGGEVGKSFDSWHDTAEAALVREADLILEIGRSDIGTGPLTNHSTGGRYPEFGPETRGKLKAAIKAAWSCPKLRAHMSAVSKDRLADPAARKKMGDAVRRWFAENPEVAKKHKKKRADALRTKEARAGAAETTREQFRRGDRRNKQRTALKAYYAEHPEVLEEMSTRTSARVADPVVRAAMSEARKKFNRENPVLAELNKAACAAGVRRPEVRAKNSASSKRRMAENPGHQAAMVRAALTPEAKAKHSAAQKKRFENPAERQKTRDAATAFKKTRSSIIAVCLALISKHGLSIPDGRASVSEWRDFETKIRTLTNDFEGAENAENARNP